MRARAIVREATPNAINAANSSNLAGAMRWSAPIVANSINGVFEVAHDLGVKPEAYIYFAWASLSTWATEANQNLWSNNLIVLTGSGTGRVTVIVGTRSQ